MKALDISEPGASSGGQSPAAWPFQVGVGPIDEPAQDTMPANQDDPSEADLAPSGLSLTITLSRLELVHRWDLHGGRSLFIGGDAILDSELNGCLLYVLGTQSVARDLRIELHSEGRRRHPEFELCYSAPREEDGIVRRGPGGWWCSAFSGIAASAAYMWVHAPTNPAITAQIEMRWA